jgi:protein-tyrosine-phosphatase
MAHSMLKAMVAQRGLAWEVDSAGTAAERYFPTPEGVTQAMQQRDIEHKHIPQLVGRALMDWADVVLPMTQGHRQHLLDLFPEHTDKTKLFSVFAGEGERDIADPIGRPLEVYQRCADELELGLKAILERHATQSH